MDKVENIVLQDILQKSIELIIKVGAFIKVEATKFDKSKIQRKGFNDLVSIVDQSAERLLVAGLSEITPEAGYLAEEGTFSDDGRPLKWIIDPLDGTTNFVHGLPIYSISIALESNGEILLGLIFDVGREECFYAVKGHGSFLNGKQISVSKTNTLADSLLATGFPYNNFKKMNHYLAILEDLMKSSHGLRRMGSAAIDLAYVACGRFEGFFEYNLNPWDVAAGVLLVQEAGGIVTDFSGKDNMVYGREIIAAGNIHPELKSTILRHWA